MDEERIAPIPGQTGYFASEAGEIFSSWQGSGPSGRPGGELHRLSLHVAGDGRVQVNLQRKTHRVANLVLAAFMGPRPLGMQSCHFPDQSSQNNSLVNLRWDTASANQGQDRVIHGTSNDGERNGSARLTADMVLEARTRYASGETHAALAAEFGVTTSAIQQAVSRTTWKTVA